MVIEEGRWSTRSVPDGLAFAAWSEMAEEYFPEYSYQGRGRHGFWAEYVRRRVGQLGFTSFHLARSEALCRPGRISSEKRFELKYICEGNARLRTAADDHTLRVGDIVLLDHQARFSFAADSAVRCACLTLPEAWLKGKLADPEANCFAVLRQDASWARTLGSMVSELANLPSGGRHVPDGLIADQIGGLLELVFGAETPGESLHRTRLAREILRQIAARHQDADLTAESLARFCGISKRYLHSLLAAADTTFGSELVRARLSHARTLLENPAFGQATVGDIAYRCGFSDPAHFSRRFRASYGLTPSDFRAAARHA